jgi:hypothetical protein
VQKMRPGGGLADVLQRGRGRWPRAGNASRIVVVDSGLHTEPVRGRPSSPTRRLAPGMTAGRPRDQPAGCSLARRRADESGRSRRDVLYRGDGAPSDF